jgi:hypothetical protein
VTTIRGRCDAAHCSDSSCTSGSAITQSPSQLGANKIHGFEAFVISFGNHIQYYPVLADMLASMQPGQETRMGKKYRSKIQSESGVMLIEAAIAIVFLLGLMLGMSQYYVMVSERHGIQKALLPALRVLMNSSPNFCYPLTSELYADLTTTEKTEFLNLVNQRISDLLIESQAIADIALNNGEVFSDPDELNSSAAYTSFFMRAALVANVSNYNFAMAIGRIDQPGSSTFITSYLQQLANFSMIQAPVTQQSTWCLQALDDSGSAQELFSTAETIEDQVKDATKKLEQP